VGGGGPSQQMTDKFFMGSCVRKQNKLQKISLT
jgi:hypothetical protein